MPFSRRNFLKSVALNSLIFTGAGHLDLYGQTPPENKDVKHWDVIVVGGGPGGVPAAVAAARNGARVLLIERYGFLGGMATSALVHPYMKYNAGDQIIIQGLFKEFLDILEENGALLPDRRTFDVESMKWLLDRFVLDSNVDLLLHTSAIGVFHKDNQIKAVKVYHKGGVEDLSADFFIDATGDGDIAAWAGSKIEIGRDSDHAVQPMTTCFRMANVEIDKIPESGEINKLYDKAKANGEIENPRENVLKFKTVHPDVVHFNTTRIIGKSALDGWELTQAECEGRRQVEQMVSFLKKYISGFEQSYLSKIAAQIGIRESRRVIGEYILTGEDVIKARHFKDAIACASYDIDIHNPSGTGTVIRRLEPGTYYQIPYRCLLPLNIDNCIVASRCISATHEAHSSLRVQPIVWALGQAAGIAAAICMQRNIIPKNVDINELQKTLTDQGAFL